MSEGARGLMNETLILVDPKDSPIGYEEKIAAHQNGGRLHRAFSIFILNSKNELLLQQRSAEKPIFRKLWTNRTRVRPRFHRKIRWNTKAESERDRQLEMGFSD